MGTLDIMTMEECSKYLKTSFSTLYKLAQEGKIPAFKLSGQWRFKKDLIDEWIIKESNKNYKNKSKN
ncbi:MAG: helix-turn-helix domain-containing protein [Candidatus Heimdallarchaeaceae archaeon]